MRPAPLLAAALGALRATAVLWLIAIAVSAGELFYTPPERFAAPLHRLLLVAVLAAATLVAARVAVAAVTAYARRTEGTIGSPSLFASIAQWLVILFGALVVLQSLGIAITPILTALGVGGLAVALALQDTLKNLFAGLQIIASRQLHPGDFVKIDNAAEGSVVDITWRTTTIRTLADNVVVIPNEKLAGSIFTNFRLPSAELNVLVPCSVAYGSDLRRVEAVALEEARATLDELGIAHRADPFVRFTEFADSAVALTVFLRVERFVDQFRARSRYIVRLHERFGREGIEIPFPQRVVTLRGAGDAR